MYNNVFKHLKRPTLYQQNETDFWNDEHISKHMLDAHLDPDFEGASRKLCFIEQSVKWIEETMPFSKYPRLLDIGCGPGLYAERFCKAGYTVTGLDFSKRSIEYAKASANKQDLAIDYVYQDYLKMDYNNIFDLVTFIYCDYAALSTENRSIILRKIYHSLKIGGKLLLDVFSMVEYNKFKEMKTWNVHEHGGFWSADKHLSLELQCKYSPNVTLKQTAVITDSEIKEYCIWDCYFTLETLLKEASEAGFQKFEVFGDVAGKPYVENSPTIAVVLEKS